MQQAVTSQCVFDHVTMPGARDRKRKGREKQKYAGGGGRDCQLRLKARAMRERTEARWRGGYIDL